MSVADSGQPYDIEVQADEAYAAAVDAGDLMRAAAQTLRLAGRLSGGLTIVITGDEEVRDLNRTYRQIDAPTDVLSFSEQESAGEDGPALALPPELAEEMGAYLGDIVIAYPYTERQAAAFANPLRSELRLLVIHGTLHLLGYDHDTPEAEARMWAAQDAALASLGEPRQSPRTYDA
jgi:probable rRNA maturation factor